MLNFRIWITLFFYLLCPTYLLADIYKYTDKNNRTHYVTSPEQIPDEYRPEALQIDQPAVNKYRTYYKAIPSINPNKQVKRQTASSGSGKVTILVTSWCKVCTRLEDFLRTELIPYTKLDVEHDSKGISLYQKIGRRGVPVVLIGKQIIEGFNPQEIKKAVYSR